MLLTEVKERKRRLEERIKDQLDQFSKDTGLIILDVELSHLMRRGSEIPDYLIKIETRI